MRCGKNKRVAITAVALTLSLLFPLTGSTSSGVALPSETWGFKGPFGQFDAAALKRGARVASEVCLGCHAIKYIQFDHLRKIGISETELMALAEGQGRGKKDAMLSPMDSETAKESFGIAPPDLSLMTKARKGYEDYLYAILMGYLNEEESDLIEKAMEDEKLSEMEAKEIASALHLGFHDVEGVQSVLNRIENGENFNKYFPGYFFAMPQPMSGEDVEYADGTEASLKQMSHDVVTFLAWAAEPTLMERQSTGRGVMLYLIILTVLLYAVKKRIWAKLH